MLSGAMLIASGIQEFENHFQGAIMFLGLALVTAIYENTASKKITRSV
jgi:hypothetical protein